MTNDKKISGKKRTDRDSLRGSSLSCIGPSMVPTLRAGDGLQIESYGRETPSVGDVVIFLHPEAGYHVVHRVVAKERGKIRTRGDNNSMVDPWFLDSHDILGKVVGRHRGRTWRPVRGGRAGDIRAFGLRVQKRCSGRMKRIFSPLYHLLLRSGVARRMAGRQASLRVVRFDKPHGPEFRLFLGNRDVGRYSTSLGRWEIRRPFRLFVNEASLPELPVRSDRPD